MINGNKRSVRLSRYSGFLRNKCLDTPKRAGKIISTSHFIPEGIWVPRSSKCNLMFYLVIVTTKMVSIFKNWRFLKGAFPYYYARQNDTWKKTLWHKGKALGTFSKNVLVVPLAEQCIQKSNLFLYCASGVKGYRKKSRRRERKIKDKMPGRHVKA